MTVKNPVRLLNLMLIAVRAINAIKRAGGEEGFKFFLNLVGLQQTETLAPVKLAAPQLPVAEPVTVTNEAPIPKLELAQTKSEVPPTALSAPKPGTPIDRPARVLQGEPPALKPRVVPSPSGDFAAKLNGAAKQLGLEDKSPLGQFRKVLGEIGRGKDYWDDCRRVLLTVLTGGLLKEEADWQLLAEKMKINMFFTNGKSSEMFFADCPKEILAALVTDQDGFPAVVGTIGREDSFNPSSGYRLSFVMDACAIVGEEAKTLLANCKNAVNRMKQRNLISADHWLVRKVAAMNHTKIPPEKYYNPTTDQPTQPQEKETVATAVPSEPQVAAPQQEAINEKSAALDLAYEEAFTKMMLSSEEELAVAAMAG
jgi:hypothetical protein